MPKLSSLCRSINLLFAFIQNASLGGLLFGWASISCTLLISPERLGGPGLSPDYVNIMFVIASFFSCLGPLLLGVALDYLGPRVSSVLSIASIGLGSLLFSISNLETLPCFIPAMCLISFGGPGVLNATIHLSNLYPGWQATTTAFLTGSFQVSFLVFYAFDQLRMRNGWNYRQLFWAYSLVCAANTVVSLLVWPDTPYESEETPQDLHFKDPMSAIRLPEEFRHHPRPKVISKSASLPCLNAEDVSLRKQSTHLRVSQSTSHPALSSWALSLAHCEGTPTKSTSLNEQSVTEITPLVKEPSTPTELGMGGNVDIKTGTFMQQVLSPEFLSLVAFFVVTSFWANFYIGTFGEQLGDGQLLTLSEQPRYARMFTVTMTSGVVAIPVVGAMMDKVGFTATSAVTIGLGVMWALFLLVESPTALLVSFVFYASFRTFLFTFLFAYMADTLGFNYYGVLSGIMFIFGGCVGVLQYPLSQYAAGTCHLVALQADGSSECSRGRWGLVNAVMAATILLSFLFSYKDWMRRTVNNGIVGIQIELPATRTTPVSQSVRLQHYDSL